MLYNFITVLRLQGGVMYLSVTITEKNLFSSHLENSSSPQYQQLSQAVEQKVSFLKYHFYFLDTRK